MPTVKELQSIIKKHKAVNCPSTAGLKKAQLMKIVDNLTGVSTPAKSAKSAKGAGPKTIEKLFGVSPSPYKTPAKSSAKSSTKSSVKSSAKSMKSFSNPLFSGASPLKPKKFIFPPG
jgi:hypothetical protein